MNERRLRAGRAPLRRAAWVALAVLAICGACASGSTRYPPALASPTQRFPETWDSPGGSAFAATTPKSPASAATTSPAEPAAASPLIAVLQFTNRLQGEDKNGLDANYVSNAVRAAVKRARPASRLMTQENIQVLLTSAHKSLADCQGECEVDTGRLLGADIIVTGDMLRVGSKLKLDMRMHETKTGQLVSGSDASGKTIDDLDADLPRAVQELMQGLR